MENGRAYPNGFDDGRREAVFASIEGLGEGADIFTNFQYNFIKAHIEALCVCYILLFTITSRSSLAAIMLGKYKSIKFNLTT